MDYYLQMDGVDDRITLPSMTFTEIVMDFRVNSKGNFERYWSLPLSAEYFQTASGAINDQWSAGVSALYLNGVAQTNLTVVMAVGTRGVARAVLSAAKSVAISVFSNGTGNIAHGDIWDIKVYNGATLAAHYDMSTGTAQDQSGNGLHATLTGGAWVNDGPVGIDVSYSYPTRQTVYAYRTAVNMSAQRVHADRQLKVSTLQRVYAGRQMDLPSMQRVYANRSYPYVTLQIIVDGGLSVSYSFVTHQAVYATREMVVATLVQMTKDKVETAATRQRVTAARQYAAPAKQVIYNDKQIKIATKQTNYALRSYLFAALQTYYEQTGNAVISVVELQGILDLSIELTGHLELTIELRGEL